MSYMDTVKLKSAERIAKTLKHCSQAVIEETIKDIQRNAIEYALTQASENADADITFLGDIAEESKRSGEPFLSEEDYEVYVINSSILNLKETIFKQHNL